jgi:hypothetical protein
MRIILLFFFTGILFSCSILQAQNSFTVTASNTQDYTINGQNDPTIEVIRGETYTFEVNASGHPFWIKSVQSTGTGNAYDDGVTNNGTQSGTISWTVPNDAPSTLYYNCQFHVNMTGMFVVNDAVPVELSSFTASLSNQMVKLEWQTQTETDNYGFDIERRWRNEDWQKIGFVAGNGTTIISKRYTFEDDLGARSNKVVYYRLKQIDTNGTFEYSPEFLLTLNLPENFNLAQNYPNPFNPSTRIEYSLAESGFVSLKVFDVLGREVRTLVNRAQEQGVYSVIFDAGELATGVYYYRIQIGDSFNAMKKMLLVR